jgi:23S rRNA (uridine2552-2'-O)-methyltransferase
MAPNLSGMDAIDAPRSMHLVELAADMAERVLKRGGGALIKVFQCAGFQGLAASVRRKLDEVTLCKPEASGPESPELYLLAKGFRLV